MFADGKVRDEIKALGVAHPVRRTDAPPPGGMLALIRILPSSFIVSSDMQGHAGYVDGGGEAAREERFLAVTVGRLDATPVIIIILG